MSRCAVLLLACGLTALTLTGCGRAGDPGLPPGVSDSTPYPGGYPDGATRTETPRSEQVFKQPKPEDPR